jgi:hypothetical protein
MDFRVTWVTRGTETDHIGHAGEQTFETEKRAETALSNLCANPDVVYVQIYGPDCFEQGYSRDEESGVWTRHYERSAAGTAFHY